MATRVAPLCCEIERRIDFSVPALGAMCCYGETVMSRRLFKDDVASDLMHSNILSVLAEDIFKLLTREIAGDLHAKIGLRRVRDEDERWRAHWYPSRTHLQLR